MTELIFSFFIWPLCWFLSSLFASVIVGSPAPFALIGAALVIGGFFNENLQLTIYGAMLLLCWAVIVLKVSA